MIDDSQDISSLFLDFFIGMLEFEREFTRRPEWFMLI